jgi:hypothetical protein
MNFRAMMALRLQSCSLQQPWSPPDEVLYGWDLYAPDEKSPYLVSAAAIVCGDVSLWPIVLQNDFGPWSEENFFQIKAK